MKTIFSVAVPSENSILIVDGISFEGKLWLVPHWLDYPQEQVSKPALMIRFDKLQHQESSGGALHDYVITRQVPKSVLDGETSEGFETLAGDQITFGVRMLRKTH